PVLVGTVSIEDNEVMHNYLTQAGVPHEVLNAKNHEREGEIIAQAGRKARITVATNMAGRGVDIKLGGSPVEATRRDEVIATGGLLVIGTERHEARRIDDQLRGRSGRQGDPGETRFYVSLEDKLMRVFAADAIKRVMGTLHIREDEPIESSMITHALENAQKRIEGFNFDSRKQILAYDDVLNTQRLAVYTRRNAALFGTEEEVLALVQSFVASDEQAMAAFEAKRKEFGDEVFTLMLRNFVLQVVDTFWLEQLETMEYLRRSVSLRAYGQRDPLIEYRREGLIRFNVMEENIQQTIREAMPHLMLSDDARIREEEERTRSTLVAVSDEQGSTPQQELKKEEVPSRNEKVTVKKGNETQEVKYKKVESLLKEGWTLVS
ncbi:MAG TPA: preprotein translocase subunit SecA, partial [Candidatus Kaiserbacteria bacterium]|nr:preprotein translocase subunit SecA [Candidatus Kaiserbacteria bacterium]